MFPSTTLVECLKKQESYITSTSALNMQEVLHLFI